MTPLGRTETISMNMKMSAIKNPKVFSGLYFWLLSLAGHLNPASFAMVPASTKYTIFDSLGTCVTVDHVTEKRFGRLNIYRAGAMINSALICADFLLKG